jgi:hypothetical protein
MGIVIAPYAEGHVEAVKAFNARLRAGGAPLLFPEEHQSEWLPKLDGRPLYDEYFLALDEGEVHGGYVLQFQPFLVGGEVTRLAQFRLPVSEGHVDHRFASVGVQLYLDAVRKEPRLYTIGLGGYDEPVSQMLIKVGWKTWTVPFYFRVLNAANFLRNIVYLRRTPLRRVALDTLAATGLGAVAVGGYQALKTRGHKRERPRVEFIEAREFGPWADDIWAAARSDYSLVGVRDARLLNIHYPVRESRWVRLKVAFEGRVVGWAIVLNVPMQDHNYFGNMRVGSLIDCLALPGMESKVTAAAMQYLRQARADIVVTNLSHRSWCKAAEAAGLFEGPSNYIFAASKAVSALIEPFDELKHRVHMTRGDGVGAQNLLEARKYPTG